MSSSSVKRGRHSRALNVAARSSQLSRLWDFTSRPAPLRRIGASLITQVSGQSARCRAVPTKREFLRRQSWNQNLSFPVRRSPSLFIRTACSTLMETIFFAFAVAATLVASPMAVAQSDVRPLLTDPNQDQSNNPGRRSPAGGGSGDQSGAAAGGAGAGTSGTGSGVSGVGGSGTGAGGAGASDTTGSVGGSTSGGAGAGTGGSGSGGTGGSTGTR
jgi:hypothetical protein